MTPLMSIAGGGDQERKMAVELWLDPENPCGGALGAIKDGGIQLEYVCSSEISRNAYLPEWCWKWLEN